MSLIVSQPSYKLDRAWSDQFIPAIRQIVGPHLLVPSPLDVDCQQAADLIVLKARDMTIAARVRRFGYAERYPYEFTIRSKRDSGHKTELSKLMDGWGDWMFYGHASVSEGKLDRWWLIDLHAWRQRLLKQGYKKGWCDLVISKSNGDGTHFVAFDLRRFSPSILIAGSHPLVDEAGIDSWLLEYGEVASHAKPNCA